MPEPACEPGDSFVCICDDGSIGDQSCLADGSGFGVCESCVPLNSGGKAGVWRTLYIHGRTGDVTSAWSYWHGDHSGANPLDPGPGPNPVAVNWDGSQRIGSTNVTIRDALDLNCTGDDWCFLACHSAGCAQVGYALDKYGSLGGVSTWNIFWVAGAGSAAGGSEIANLKLWNTTMPIDQDLTTIAVRQLYTHDNTQGVEIFLFAGAGYSDSEPQYTVLGAQLPGDDDLAVAYHSACGVNNDEFNAENTWCNSSDFICTGNYVTRGRHNYLWSMHGIYFLDADAIYSHFLSDANYGICAELFAFTKKFTQPATP